MSIKENKALHRLVYSEIWNKGDLVAVDKYISVNYIYHPLPGASGLDWYKEQVRNWKNAF